MNKVHTCTDHLGRELRLPVQPQRIISLCPSQTATLFHLGLGARIVGRTNFCLHPQPEIDGITRVGGTKKLRFEAVAALEPDLIIAEKEENTPEMVAALAANYPVYVTEVQHLSAALRMIRDLGEITGKLAEGQALAKAVAASLAGLKPLQPGCKCAYLIWRKPWMAAGQDTFIEAMLQLCGLQNIALQWEGRYPEFDLTALVQAKPDVILLSSEPFPFATSHCEEIQAALPQAKVKLVDGEMFSWYGSHLLQSAKYLQDLLSNL